MLIYLFIFSLLRVSEQSLLCPNGGIPEGLVSASVWQKTSPQNLTIFRVGGNELSNEGYVRSGYDKNLFTVLLSRASSKLCPPGSCTFKLSANARLQDGAILHQENVFGAPSGYQELRTTDPLYCVRIEGDCGADVPIYRYTKVDGLMTEYAYSLDAVAAIPGFTREPAPICYGWSDGGSHKVANSLRISGCKKLQNVLNGEVRYQPVDADPYPIGSTASLACNTGYTTNGPTELSCSETGWYPNDAFGECRLPSVEKRVEARCWPLPAPLNGRVVYSKDEVGAYSQGTLAHLQCRDGYTPSSPTQQAKCEKNGQWTTQDLGKCEPLCRNLPTIPNGKIRYITEGDGLLTIGAMVHLQCSPGYTVVGLDTVTCEASGWVPFPGIGSCVPIPSQCPFALPAVFAGKISYTQGGPFGSFPSGTVGHLECSSGLTVHGNSSSTCRGATWDPPVLGICVPASTAMIPRSLGSAGGTTQTVEGTIETNLNRASGVGNTEVSTPISITSTTALTAESNEQCLFGMTKPIDGNIVYSQGGEFGPYPAGTIATLRCNGYSVQGETSTCQNGFWYPPSFSPCTKDIPSSGVGTDASLVIECLTGIPSPLHGQVAYSDAQVSGPFPSGTIATIFCNRGYVATGPTTSTCQSGTWSPATVVQCIPGGSSSLMMAGVGIAGPIGFGSCLAGLPVPLNGRIDYSDLSVAGPYPSGTSATLFCNLGFTVTGPATAICSNGMWSPSTLGECVLGATGGLGPLSVGTLPCPMGLPMPLNGFISYSLGIWPPYPAGTVATVICNLGFSPSGTPTSTCNNGAWYPPTPAQCVLGGGGGGSLGVVGQCGPLGGPINGEVVYTPVSLTPTYNSGTVATLTCNLGFIPSGQTTATCMNGIWEPTVLGSCVPGLGGGGVSQGQCPFALPAPINGHIQYSTGSPFGPYNEGTSATLACTAGFIPSGSVTSLCTNGAWEPPSLGMCTIGDETEISARTGQCHFFTNFEEGQIHYSRKANKGFHRTGTLAALKCHKTYPLNGRFSVCQNGTWVPPLQRCEDRDQAQATTVSFSSCPKLPIPMNAKIFYIQASSAKKFEVGTMAILSCNTGYDVSGQVNATCMKDGWDPGSALGECVEEGTRRVFENFEPLGRAAP